MKKLLEIVSICGLLLSVGSCRAITTEQSVKEFEAAIKAVTDDKVKTALNKNLVIIKKLSAKQIALEKRQAAAKAASKRNKRVSKKTTRPGQIAPGAKKTTTQKPPMARKPVKKPQNKNAKPKKPAVKKTEKPVEAVQQSEAAASVAQPTSSTVTEKPQEEVKEVSVFGEDSEVAAEAGDEYSEGTDVWD